MNIGLLGFGVVGRGVYDMLADRDDIRAAWVLCRRDLGELTARTTYDIQDILSDPAVDTVVEVMGGLHPAYEYVAAALRAGKNVVSSNKYLMCRYYDELNALAKEYGAALRCTAAVGGGIPWLTNLEKAARANHISRVWGILNGTTNYIMDAMHSSDVDFADVLAQAQALGYAEADPSADIDGLDIQRKLILSANVAFGVSLAGGGWAEEGAMPGFFAAQHFGGIRDMEGFALRELHAGAQLHINHADFSSFLCGISEQRAPEAVPRPVPFEGIGRIGGIRRDAREIRRPAEERTKQGILRQRGDGKQQHPAEQQGRKCSFHNGFTSADDTVNIPESVRKYTGM